MIKASRYLSKKAAVLIPRAKAAGLVLGRTKLDVWRLYYGDLLESYISCKNLAAVERQLEIVEWAKKS